MKKLFRSKKALSPVVAAIILIAVTVAVSIAVAAWMGALTFTFMATEQVKITNVVFGGSGGSKYINITVQNTGTSPVTINELWINGAKQTSFSSTTISANTQTVINLSFTWTAGSKYEIKLVSSKGNQFYYTATAPTS